MIRNCLKLLLLVAVQLSCTAFVQASDVVYRSLIAPSETIRFQEIQRLSQDSQRLSRYLDSIAAAVNVHGNASTDDRPLEASTVATFELIGRMKSPESEGILNGFLDSDNAEVVILALSQLGKHRYVGSIERISQLSQGVHYRERYAFRFSVVRSLIEMNHADASDRLLDLRGDLDGQLRYHVDTFLDGLEVDDFDGNPERFNLFRERMKQEELNQESADAGTRPEVRLASASGFFSGSSEEPESRLRMRLKPQQYYGIEIHSKRILFILDHSGSMKDPWYGMTRLERAKGELIKAVRELSGDVEFGIVCFHTRVHHWNDELVEATEANKDLAIEFVNRLGYGDRTNTYGALRTALDYDADLEAVYLLTDGKPTIGELVAHQAILLDILHRNRFRHLNLNTIGVAVDGFTRQFLKRLADESGGEFRDAHQ